MKTAASAPSALRGPGPEPRRRPAGFTLLELLLALALIGLLSGALIVGVNGLLKKSRASADEVLAQTMLAARELALVSDQAVSLRYDTKEKQLIWSNGLTTKTAALPQTPPVTLQFLQPRASSAILIGGQLIETREVPVVQFYPDGTCDAFRVQWQQASLPPRVVTVDPWTCVTLPADRT